MRVDSPFKYLLFLDSKTIGPYDRRTLVGMKIKGLVELNTRVQRSDGHAMSIAQLIADRFEMADAQSLEKQAAQPPSSGFWPQFTVLFGGSLFKPGAFGFIGEGEVRYQGDVLRISGRRKSGVVSIEQTRIKLALSQIARAQRDGVEPTKIILYPRKDAAFENTAVNARVSIDLNNAEYAAELLELLNLPVVTTY